MNKCKCEIYEDYSIQQTISITYINDDKKIEQRMFYIQCSRCGLSSGLHITKKAAIENWNQINSDEIIAEEIKNKLNFLKQKEQQIQNEIKILQEKCQHKKAIISFKSNCYGLEGHDSYWIEFECPNCEKYENIDNSDPQYKKIIKKYRKSI